MYLIALVLNALIASNAFPTGSEASKIAMMISTCLAALGYGANQTMIKRAHLQAQSGYATARASYAHAIARVAGGVTTLAISFFATMMLGSAVLALSSCAPAQQAATCTLTTLEQSVGNQTLGTAVENALLQDNYLAALEAIATTAGEDAVNCVLAAIRDLNATGSSAAPATPAAMGRAQLLHDRAVDALSKRTPKK